MTSTEATIDRLVAALRADALTDLEAWGRALWRGEQPDAEAFAERLAAAMLIATLDGAVTDAPRLGRARHCVPDGVARYGIGSVFKTVFRELLDALTRKAPILSALSPRDVDEDLRQTAFFVSGVTTGQIVEEIRDVMHRVREQGGTQRDFIARVQQVSGLRTAAELETVFRTNVASAAAAGRWKQMNDPDVADLFCGYRYVSRKKPTTRPLHAAMDGFVATKDDPIWGVIWPANGYNCMCMCRGVMHDDGVKRGLIDADGNVLRQRIYADPLQEEVVEAALAGLEIVVEGKPLLFPDEGFRGNALAGL